MLQSGNRMNRFTQITIALVFGLLSAACSEAQLPLKTVADIPLTGNATRLDYQSFDPVSGRLYIAHLGDDMLTVFDTRTQSVVGDVRDLKHVHGVLAVPELHRIYASATGTNELVVIDDQTLAVVTRIPAGTYPDGIGYASKENKIYVSDKNGKTETVIDAASNKVVSAIPLGGPVGNTQYNPVSDRILVAVHKLNAIVEIDPSTDKIVETFPLTGCEDPHGLLIDAKDRLVFAACEANAKLAVLDLAAKKLVAVYPVGDDPDVLAFDTSLSRLYVSAESGDLTIFDEKNGSIVSVAKGYYAARAHTVAVDSSTHKVYFPLENLNGKPTLRIAVSQ